MKTARTHSVRAIVVLLGAGALALGAAAVGSAQSTRPSPPANADDNLPEVGIALERFKRGDLNGALEKLQEAKRAHPELPPAKLMLARLLLAANQAPTGRALLEDVATEDPRYPVTFVLFGNLALNEGRINDAALNYQHARELLDGAPVPDDQRVDLKVQVLSGLAAVAERRRDWVAARTTLEEILQLKPEDGLARQRFARALFQLDRRDDARAELEKAVQSLPTLDPPGITLGWFLAEAEAFDEAQASMEEAVRREPESLGARLGLGTFLLQRERPDAARPHAEKALAIAPDSSPARRLLGAVAYRLDDLAVAERQLRAALQAAPEDLGTTNLLALVLADQPAADAHEQAVELAEQNVQRGGQTPQTLATLGWAYYRAGRLDEALQVLQAATSSGQATPDTAYYLACVLADKGQEADALRLLRSALDAPVGQFAERADARKRLEQLVQKVTQPAPAADTKPATAKPAAPPAAAPAPKAATPTKPAAPAAPARPR